MKPARFSYLAPTTVDEAVQALAEHGDEAKVLAGGQSLVPVMALRLAAPAYIIDLNKVTEMQGVTRDGDQVVIGAMTRQRVAEDDPIVKQDVPLLAAALPWVAHFQIRNRGTVGGSIAHADPSSEIPAVAVALDAELDIRSARGQRRQRAREFFQSTFTTDLEDDELLVAVRFPAIGPRTGIGFHEVARRHGDFALAGAAATVELDGDQRISQCGLGLFGVANKPLAASAVEEAMVGRGPDELDLEALGRQALDGVSVTSDSLTSEDYRRTVGAHTAAQALRDAIKHAASTAGEIR